MHWQVCITASLLLAGFTCTHQKKKTVETSIHNFAVKVSGGLVIVQTHLTRNSPTTVHRSLLEEMVASGPPSKEVSPTLLLYCTHLASHQLSRKEQQDSIKNASRQLSPEGTTFMNSTKCCQKRPIGKGSPQILLQRFNLRYRS